jgi:hypothetical protein
VLKCGAESRFQWRAANASKSLELKTVMKLTRPLREQGKKDEARRMLAEIYGWFTEGFDTADLKDAKALLDALS